MGHNCKGCFAGLHGCNGSYNYRGTCPCTNCLIKVMCDEECEIYGKFTDRVNKLLRVGLTTKEIVEALYEKNTNNSTM